MTPEQEIRLEALKLKTSIVAQIMNATIIKGDNFHSDFWADGILEDFVNYITEGKKPEPEIEK